MKPLTGTPNTLNPYVLYVLYTYNRPFMLKKCIETLLHPENLTPSRILVLDDASNPEVKKALLSWQLADPRFPIDVLSLGRNVGYGMNAEFGFSLVEAYNPSYVYFIESDYIFSPTGLKTVQWLFENNDLAQNAIGFSGYDNPDFYDPAKYDKMFREVIMLDCAEDNLNRDIMFKPTKHTTPFGEVELEFTSNSCGTMYFNWKKIQEIRAEFPVEYRTWIDRITDKYKPGRRCLGDGVMSHGISWLWTEWAKKHGVDTTKYGALLNVKPSVSNHINGGMDSINGHIVPEGSTFVSSPSWKGSE